VRSLPPRAPYYPGFDDRQRAAVAAHPDAELLDGDLPDGCVPRTLITGLDPEADNETCFDTEFFCHVHAVTELGGDTPAEFLERAVDFANNRLAGTLGANLLVHPTTIRELGPALDDAIASLRYGCVGVNAWAGLGYLLARCSWGAFPGHTDDDIQSGRGTVHNALLFDRPQKSVVTAPFSPFPRTLANGRLHLLPIPPWFVTHRRAAKVGRRLTFYAANPGPMALPGIFAAALRP
jgi:aldehyde dehydrogenase (NAD(P)+)